MGEECYPRSNRANYSTKTLHMARPYDRTPDVSKKKIDKLILILLCSKAFLWKRSYELNPADLLILCPLKLRFEKKKSIFVSRTLQIAGLCIHALSEASSLFLAE